MLKNHLKIALRNIKRHSLRAFIHVIGLSIGIAACFVIYNLVSYEYGFDTFHKEAEQINRVTTLTGNGEESWPNPGVPIPLADAIRAEMKSATALSQIYTANRFRVASIDKSADYGSTENVVFVDSAYFDFFEYRWLAGNPDAALRNPYSVVLSRSSASQYFGVIPADKVIGKELLYADSLQTVVTGVVADLAEQTDLIFKDFISLSTMMANPYIRKARNVEDWGTVNSSSQIFVKVAPQLADEAETELLAINKKYIEPDGDWTTEFDLEPLSEMHFNFNYNDSTADKATLNGLMLIGFFILLIACINFINLETAQSRLRAKEVGVRKTLGSSRKQLVRQFLTETYVIILSAILIATLLSQLATAYFREVLPVGFTFEYVSVSNGLFLVALSLVVLLLSGIYPAVLLSGYSPVKALKSNTGGQKRFNFQYFLRKNLIVFQFASSIAFIIVVLTINSQIDFLLNQNVGFNKEAVVHTNTPFNGGLDKTKALKTKIEGIAGVQSVSMSSDMLISNSLWTTSVEHELNGTKEEIYIQTKVADPNYLELYQVPFLAGRNYTLDESEVVINEAALEKLGIQDPQEALGKNLIYDEQNITIVGVVQDVHTQSMRETIRPMMMGYDERNLFTMNIKLAANTGISQVMEQMQEAYKAIYSNETSSFQFLDETVANFYRGEQRLRKVLVFATAIAILISCLGLFGLASFTIAQRTKEISIRKVLGATVSNIILLISKEYALLMGISFALSIYPAWYFIADWLGNFEFKIEMSAGIYMLSGLIAFILAIGIVAGHSVKAANSNPAKVLKDE